MSYVGKVTDYGGTTHLVGSTLYGTCSTQGNVAAKVVVCSDFNKLITGVTIHVKFTYPNTAASPTLNVNSTGAKPIYKGSSTPAASTDITWPPDSIVSFTYDGTNWVMNDTKDNDVLQSPVSTNNQYEVLFSHSANNTAETAGVGKNDGFLYNPYYQSVTIGSRSLNDSPGQQSFAQGSDVLASGSQSHAQGYNTVASGLYSHAEGNNTDATGEGSHAEGNTCEASGIYSHAEGDWTNATAKSSHAEGHLTYATGEASHAEGHSAVTSGLYSHAEGFGTKATHRAQHVFGEFNKLDPSTNASTVEGTYVEIVGNGNNGARTNARTLDWSGNQWIAGNYSDTNGLLAMKEVTQAQYDALTTDEKNNGTAYFITDRLSPAATDLWTKVGTATLNTTAKDCSGAINELNSTIRTQTHYYGELLDSGSIKTMTTATSKNLNDKFTKYNYLVIQFRSSSNVMQTTVVTSSYFNGTSSTTRVILVGFSSSGSYLGTVEVYKNTDSSVYIKVSSNNTFGTGNRIYIIGVMKKLQ